MSLPAILFYVFAAIMLFAALRVVIAKNPVHAALFLVLAFFSAAAIWLLHRAEFLAMTLILVYVGAVMVLFLFVVMMLDINMDKLRAGFNAAVPVGIMVGLLIFVEMSMVLFAAYKKAPALITAAVEPGGNTRALGKVLYVEYVYPFELAAVVLLVAIIAAIALTHRKRVGTRFQNPSEQVKVQRADRVRLVKMDAIKPEAAA
jgi:NADH-quinone oxidoreductase subunit J